MTTSKSQTPTKSRIVVTLKVPNPLAAILKAESKETGRSFASFVRRAINWHNGKGLARHPGRRPVVLAPNPTGATTQKSSLVDLEHIDYLDMLGNRVGLPRTATLLVIIVQYLGIDPLRP
tara:strand:+ start:6068 stop:6427 length:360 start_codon:yes stop_codon:yes gene_type:complete